MSLASSLPNVKGDDDDIGRNGVQLALSAEEINDYVLVIPLVQTGTVSTNLYSDSRTVKDIPIVNVYILT